MAKSFLSILPDIKLEEAMEVSKVYSLAGLLSEDNYLIDYRVLRSPHHSASVSAIVGGGSWPKPGEISLAHNNVLFLDEILEFPRPVLEALRQPLEDKVITVSRVKGSFDFPANFILLATANPCPCGYFSDELKECKCSSIDIRRYQKRISGPVLDRIDLHLSVKRVKSQDLDNVDSSESSEAFKQRVSLARYRQAERQANLNSDIDFRTLRKYCVLTESGQKILRQATDNLQLSARAHFKVLKVARTIADLANDSNIRDEYVLEALQYRNRIFVE